MSDGRNVYWQIRIGVAKASEIDREIDEDEGNHGKSAKISLCYILHTCMCITHFRFLRNR